jgi:hypothetical protein
MSDPIVFISRNIVKEGLFEDFKNHYQGSISPIMAGKPDTLVQLAYFNEETQEATIVRIFPDADGLDQQLQGADQRSKAASQFIKPIRIEIYGTPSMYALEMMTKVAGLGIKVHIYADYLGGFIRSWSG